MTWWVICTDPACEQRVVRSFEEAGLTAWTPTRLVKFKSRHMRHAIERAYPTFPNYAFVEVGDNPGAEEWHRIRNVEEVRAILVNAGRPLRLSDLEMARVRDHLDGLAHKPVDADVWRKDDRARISEGPFQGQEGIVERGERRGSVKVLLSLFGRSTAAEVLVEQLERAA